eukprot:3799689-Prorocentrum_lima.AAC.1
MEVLVRLQAHPPTLSAASDPEWHLLPHAAPGRPVPGPGAPAGASHAAAASAQPAAAAAAPAAGPAE